MREKLEDVRYYTSRDEAWFVSEYSVLASGTLQTVQPLCEQRRRACCSTPSRVFECRSLFKLLMAHPRHSRPAAMSFLIFSPFLDVFFFFLLEIIQTNGIESDS
jgi:hypothetical protein